MPRPFRGPHTDYSVDALLQRPELAKHIGIIAGMWAYLESKLSDLLGAMLRADKYTGALMFANIKSEPARLAVMQAIAEDRLTESQAERFMKLKKKIANTGNQRDRLVHGLWALPLNNPVGIILVNSRNASIFNAMEDVTRRKGSRRTESDIEKYLDSMKKYESSFLEYMERDFIEIENNIRERLEEIKSFDLGVWWLHDRRQIHLRRRK